MKNESKADRIIRAILALAFLYLAFYVFADTASLVFYALALVMIVTAIVGFCPLYKLFGINTAKKA